MLEAKPALGTRLHTTGIFVREAADAYDIQLPHWTAKLALRLVMDLAPPNWIFELALSTSPMAVLARRIFFHRTGPVPRPIAPREPEAGALSPPV